MRENKLNFLDLANVIFHNFISIVTISKFQVLHTPINCSIKMVDDIILALCVLHNFIRHHEGILSTPSGEQNVQETVNEHVRLANQNRPTNPALLYRDKLCDFFLKPEGALAWQEKYYL